MRFFFETLVFFLVIVKNVHMKINGYMAENGGISEQSYMFWPNATIPFYINPDHFDDEQATSIMTTLALFAFKTCLKFLPVLAPPDPDQHVLVFANPVGTRQCVPSTLGHPVDEPHLVILGYECLRPPHIEMMIMKALGFPFEHNRASRDVFIEVQQENIDPSAMELFTKDAMLPLELRNLAYDIDSVMHFGERHFSKNGHRTIIFKERGNRPVKQNRVGLSPTDLRKIEIVYGPECRKRDRQEKIEMCQNYPVARRKRDVAETENLRVNRDITPPPIDIPGNLNDSLRELGIEDEVQEVVDHVYKVSSRALRNARAKYCNLTKPDLRISSEKVERNNSNDILGIIETIADYARNMVDNAVANLTQFCRTSESIETYQRAKCPYFGGRDCPVRYKSTKSGPVRYSTQHRPIIPQSTKHRGEPNRAQYAVMRAGNDTQSTTPVVRRKRNVDISINQNKSDKEKPGNEATTVVDRNDNETDVVDTGKDALKGDIRTDRPQGRKMGYEAEWPSPERNRRVFMVKKKGRLNKEWEDSNVSVEEQSEKNVRHRENLKKKGRSLKESSQGSNDSAEEHRDENVRHREKPVAKGKKIRGNRNKSGAPRDQTEDNLESLPKTVKLSKENQEFYDDRKWPGGVVTYTLDENTDYDVEDVRARLAEVNSILKKKTCVRLEEISAEDAKNYEDYLVLDTSADYVTGRVGGKQNFGSLELYRGGQHRQHAAMMVMAMLGFYFELARHDRDEYVRVHLRHVRPDKLHHFEKIRSDATFPLPYDYESATHPAWQFWRKVGISGISCVATFKTKDPDGTVMKSLGQHEKLLSDMDLIKINSVYGTKCFKKTRSGKSGKKKHHLIPEEENNDSETT